MPRTLTIAVDRWPVAGTFVIARGAKTFVDVVTATISDGGITGRGEATPIYYHGETAESVAAQLHIIADAVATGMGRLDLAARMPRGAARNALDAALWDLEAKQTDVAVWKTAGLLPPGLLTTAFTLSLDTPARMEVAARAASPTFPLLKLKLAGEGDRERVAAVRRGAPNARLIVDANEAWTARDVAAEAAGLMPFDVELIEQPVRAGEDYRLDGISSPIPLCADESIQDREDLARCVGRYAAINIKLDKAGGLTEGLALARDAKTAGLEIMVGCMLSTSLGVAPAFLLAQQARWVDLDGPLLLAHDHSDGFRFKAGQIHPALPGFWG